MVNYMVKYMVNYMGPMGQDLSWREPRHCHGDSRHILKMNSLFGRDSEPDERSNLIISDGLKSFERISSLPSRLVLLHVANAGKNLFALTACAKAAVMVQ